MTSCRSSIARSLFALAWAAAFQALPAQQAASRSEFIVRKGKDTVAVEIFSRDGSTLTSDISQSNGVRTQYTLNLRPDSVVQRVELTRQNRQGGGVSIVVNFGDTLVSGSISGGGESTTMDFPSRGGVTPFLAVSFALAEQIVFASHVAPGKSAKWVAVRLGVADTASLTVTRFHADSVLLAMADVQLKVALSPDGKVVGGRHMGQDWLVERKTLR